MKYLVFGGYGQLGSALAKYKPEGVQVIQLDSGADITDYFKVKSIIDEVMPDVVVNCAAYTNVNKAEQEQDKAFSINALGPSILTKLCSDRQIRFIHISSDYVFDGRKSAPYNSWDDTNPLNVYGVTKEAGEIFASGHKWYSPLVIRTSWVYSEFGNNFAKTILKRLENGITEFNVVDDQIGTPTYAGHIAEAIFEYYGKGDLFLETGIVHFSGNRALSWYDFTKLLTQDVDSVIVSPTKTVSQVERPAYSALASSFGIYSNIEEGILRTKQNL